MDELLSFLFAAAIQYSGLPPTDTRPPVTAMPYDAMLLEICTDLKAEVPSLLAQYSRCTQEHAIRPAVCDELKSAAERYDHCTRQTGLMSAYIIEQQRIVYRDDIDPQDDSDNSFIVHEFVHALQHRQFGDQMFATCQGVIAAERQAYDAQQRYLKARGQLLRVGDRLRFLTCNAIR